MVGVCDERNCKDTVCNGTIILLLHYVQIHQPYLIFMQFLIVIYKQ